MFARMSAISATMCVAFLATIGIAFAEPVDESALREYARQNRADRVEMETRRLERLHPEWMPPADLWTSQSSGLDEAPLWDLYEAGDLGRLRQAIAERQSEQAGWKPSDDLVAKIKAKEVRATIFDRAVRGSWVDVAQLASDNGLAHGTRDIELLWSVAEAFARTGRGSEAAALYKSVLESRTYSGERVGTILKALSTLPMAESEKLIKMGQVGTEGRNEFDVMRIDNTRARISAFLRNDSSNMVEGSDLTAFEEFARQSPDPNQAALVAWYAYRRGKLDAALDWFNLSMAHRGDAMVAHGLALTLLKLDRRREAEDVAFTWREQLANNAILFIDVLETDLTREVPPHIEPARIARYAQVTMKTQSGEGAQGLAWYAYNNCELETAVEWFQRAVAWFPKQDTVYGYALTLQRLNRHREFVEIVNRYDGLFPKVVGLVFKDDLYHPPNPCDTNAVARVASARSSAGRDLEAYRSTASIGQDAGHAAGGGAVRPAGSSDAGAIARAMRRVARADFPISVSPENPLRFATRASMPLDRAGRSTLAFRTDRRLGGPLVARRVPGVDAMPYERFGIALLPAWNGATTVKIQNASYYSAAVGTIWSEENAAPVRAASITPTPARPEQPPARSRP
jgi:tetratricopeptide (TPR) repeat protein